MKNLSIMIIQKNYLRSLQQFITKCSLLFLFILTTINIGYAHSLSYITELERSGHLVGTMLGIEDPNRSDDIGIAPNINYVVNREVQVALVYDREERSDILGNYWWYRVHYELFGTGSNVPYETGFVEINHQLNGGIYESLNKYVNTTGTTQLKIVQLEASTDAWQTTSSNPNGIIPEDIRLELRMEVDRIDYLPELATTSLSHEIAGHSLQLYWKNIVGAEYYELEWVYIDEQVNVAPDIASRFENAISVELKEQEYKIQMLFPAGELYYRVRAVGRFIRGQSEYTSLKFGSWTESTTPVLLQGFESNRNWQTVSSFAEEGKSKHVVNYFDKSLRSRQSQVNLSTEEQILVSTNHYDFEGRGTLNILPVPAKGTNNNLFYKPQFNKNTDGITYNRNNFDKSTYADPVSTEKGAGYYFSPTHALDSSSEDLYKDYLPDAEAYPLTQTVFSNDGLGRVMEQGGVGAFYQIGKGTTTKYHYDDPSDTQLRRLFGKNVGAAKYYKRNIVEDPNGQLSVSYLDISGRVIATALAGASPSNVDTLAGRNTKNLTESLIENNVINLGLGNSVTNTKIMNETVGNSADFNYSFKGKNESFLLPDGDICLSCEYELIIRMTDPCGAPVAMHFPDSTTTVFRHSYTGADICLEATYDIPEISFSITMGQVGTYQLRKELRVVEKDVADWVQVLNAGGLLPPTSYFDSLFIAQIDTTACEFTCRQLYYEVCFETGTQGGLTGETLDDYVDTCIIARCEALIPGILDTVALYECQSLYNQMIWQISPGGCLYSRDQWWDDYANSDISALQFEVLQDDGTYITLAGSDAQMQMYLQDPNEWQGAWGEILVLAHPEYCDYKFCEDTDASRLHDFNLARTKNYTDALAKGLAKLVNGPEAYGEAIRQLDPAFFSSSPLTSAPYNCTDLSDDMKSALINYYSEDLDCNGDGILDNTAGSPMSLGAFVACYFSGETEEVRWQRLVGLYKGLKEKLLRTCQDAACPGTGDGCSLKQDLDILEINTQEEAEAYAGEHLMDFCATVCIGNAAAWTADLVALCGNLDPLQIDQIKDNFTVYCTESCGYENPMGLLLTGELSNVNLQNIANILTAAACPVAILNDLATTIEESYTIAVNEDGDTLYHQILGGCYINSCIEDIIHAADDMVRYNDCVPGGTSYNLTNDPNVEAYDWTPVYNACIDSLGGFGNDLPIKSSSLGIGFIYVDDFTPGNVNVCYMNRILNPHIFFDGVVHHVHADAVIFDPNDPSNVDTVLVEVVRTNDLLDIPFVLCTDTTTLPILIPKEDTLLVNVDTIRQYCLDELYAEALILAEEAWQDSVDALLTEIINQQNCIDSLEEHLSVNYQSTEHHYTLYYYDQAGNLIQTVPPAGVHPLGEDSFNDKGEWIAGNAVPLHQLLTEYRYNMLGQVYWQNSPDAEDSRFYYDDAQRLRLSQNAQQQSDGKYSYTKYDAQNRIVEVGQIENYTLTPADLNEMDFPNNLQTLTEQTKTYYDDSYNDPTLEQRYLRNRVSYTENEHIRTLYSYDVHGNVNALQHEVFDFTNNVVGTIYPGIDKHRIDYRYDLISGNVLEVAFQKGKRDEFYHRYEYDADNRLTFVKTSDDGSIWECDARYFYYAHGPLARVELGNDKVQGQDYYYNLQGWIKGVNQGGILSHSFEMGLDGHATDANNEHGLIARDEYAYMLGYHNKDYKAINAQVNLGSGMATIWNDLGAKILTKDINGVSHYGLFNGNIAMMFTDIKSLNGDLTGNEGMQTMTYQYDQLHRIRKGFTNHYVANTGKWELGGDYDTEYNYDPDGNINELKRYGKQGLMDDLSYTYKPHNHQLTRVEDDVDAASYNNDLDNPTMSGDIYEYDDIGNLIRDLSEQIETIKWSVYGKPLEVIFEAGSNKENIRYTYDGSGNRLSKTKISPIPGRSSTSFYIRDASGNIMSIYKREYLGQVRLFQKEAPIFGSNRLGVRNFAEKHLSYEGNVSVVSVSERVRGLKAYELSNHLGNVLATVSDYKRGIDTWVTSEQDGKADYYLGSVRSANDYYPFGLAMQGRTFTGVGGYRYGFNGKENDGDFQQSSQGQLIQDYGFRIYNPSIGKFLSVDPLTKSYPWYTPYQFAGNTPVWASDLDGLEPDKSNTNFYRWLNTPNLEVRTDLENRVETYEGGATAFGHNIPLTRDMLMDDINDAVDGRAWFGTLGYYWAKRNLTKYLLGGGGLDIYGFDELNKAREFGKLVKRVNKNIKRELKNELKDGDNERTLENVHASYSGRAFSDFTLSLGASQIFANVTFTTSTGENNETILNGDISYTFFDTYDWGPARRNGLLKYIMGIADHWQLIDLQNIGSEDFYTRAYFSSSFTATFTNDKLKIIFSDDYQDSFDLSTHPEPEDDINRLPADLHFTHDGRRIE